MLGAGELAPIFVIQRHDVGPTEGIQIPIWGSWKFYTVFAYSKPGVWFDRKHNNDGVGGLGV